jgi:hypothetical protein
MQVTFSKRSLSSIMRAMRGHSRDELLAAAAVALYYAQCPLVDERELPLEYIEARLERRKSEAIVATEYLAELVRVLENDDWELVLEPDTDVVVEMGVDDNGVPQFIPIRGVLERGRGEMFDGNHERKRQYKMFAEDFIENEKDA